MKAAGTLLPSSLFHCWLRRETGVQYTWRHRQADQRLRVAHGHRHDVASGALTVRIVHQKLRKSGYYAVSVSALVPDCNVTL